MADNRNDKELDLGKLPVFELRIPADMELSLIHILLALKTKAPIVPMYITEKKGKHGRVNVIIGKPFLPDPKSKDYAALSQEIMRRIYELKPEEERLSLIHIYKPRWRSESGA